MTTRTLLAPLSLLFLASAVAQPTLDLGNNGPVPVGAPFAVSAYTSPTEDFSSGAAGADGEYSFWMVPQTGNNDRFFVAPNATTEAAMTGVTVVSSDGGSDSTFYKVDDAGVELIGSKTGLEGLLEYTDGIMELVYPCTFGTTWTDIFSADYLISGSIPVTRAGSVSGIADGYGRILLPGLELDNVLRVKVRRIANDVSAIASVRRTFDTYYFYTEGVKYPVMKTSVDSVTINAGTAATSFSMEWLYGEGEVAISELDASQAVFTPYPNPTNGMLDLRMDGNASGVARIEVIEASGKVALQVSSNVNGNALSTIDLSSLAPGAYHVRLTLNDGSRSTQKVIVH